jgi:rare lipoprotein A
LRWAIGLAMMALLAGCATSRAPSPGSVPEPAPERVWEQTGTASWYGSQHQGRLTASGETFDMHALTAAHATLPMGARVLVTNLKNGRSVQVRINDRGPIVPGRIIDVSRAAAQRLGAVSTGTFPVRLRMVST